MPAHQHVVRMSSRFERLAEKLSGRHPEFDTMLEEVITILEIRPKPKPPSEGDEEQDIIKLEGRRPGEGQYRLKRKRWRFLYDIAGRDVELLWCGLRDEKTYRR
jgi:hypothetical protein